MSHDFIRKFPPWLAVLWLNMLYLGAILALNGSDPATFVTQGTCYSACSGQGAAACPAGTTEGYDGQFAYYIARDPAGAPDCLDIPAYRMQRILLPLLVRVLSLGRAALIPWALVAVNLVALAGGTALLADLLAAEGVNRWYTLVYGLFAGVFMAVRLSTPEPLAYGLALAAIRAVQRDRTGTAVILLALAVFAKETTLPVAAGVVLSFALRHRWRAALGTALAVGGLFGAWQIALWSWLGRPGIGAGGAGATGFDLIPFGGVWRIAADSGLLVFAVLGLVIIPAAVLPAVWGLWRTLRDVRAGRAGLVACLLLANAAVFPFLPFSTYREFLGLLRNLPGLVLTLLLYTAHLRATRGEQRPLRYSTLWVVLLLFVVSG
jgi:hypothetical protein